MNRDRQLKKDMESREVQIHEEYEKNRHLMSEDKVKEHQKKQQKWKQPKKQQNSYNVGGRDMKEKIYIPIRIIIIITTTIIVSRSILDVLLIYFFLSFG